MCSECKLSECGILDFSVRILEKGFERYVKVYVISFE